MSEKSDLPSFNVAIARGNNTNEALREGIDNLGGIINFIQEKDIVFIKISLKNPFGYPTNSNLETLGALIDLSKNAGAREVFVGDFPADHIKSEKIIETTGLLNFLESKGARFAYLDNEELFPRKEITINDRLVKIPALILNADKFIILNQVNVDPTFIITFSYLNLYSIIPNINQKIQRLERPGKDYLSLDQYKQDLISNILSVSSIRSPNLVINDLFFLLERAGPLIYKDSRSKKTNLLVIGDNLFAVDYTTLKLMNIDISKSELLLGAQNHQSGILNLDRIKPIGENPTDIKIKIQMCVSKLEDINVKNCFLYSGRYCSGCYNKMYHILNFLKTTMTKDLKYMGYFNFLIGENPPEPEDNNDIIIYGDCAIQSTSDRNFRKVVLQKKPNPLKALIRKIKKKSAKSLNSSDTKIVKNKNILEIPGCPPDFLEFYRSLFKYYGKGVLPNLTFFQLISNIFIDKND
jgi:uncharacterized protein (DUF362 family)